jgi:hypothetical protein
MQCAANCGNCIQAGADKCDRCSDGYGTTSSGTCAKVWARFMGVVSTLDASKWWGLAISFAHPPASVAMFPCSVRQTVFFAAKLASAVSVLVAMASPQQAHAQRCGLDLWIRTSSCLCCTELPAMILCSARQTALVAQKLELASAIVVMFPIVKLRLAMASPQMEHAQRCGVDLLVSCVLIGSLTMCHNVGASNLLSNILLLLLHSNACSVSLQCVALCNECGEAGAGKCDRCFWGHGRTSSGTCAKVWARFMGVVSTLDASKWWGLAISFAHPPASVAMFPCSVRQTVFFAAKLASAVSVLVAMASPQQAHAQRCGEIFGCCVY